MQNKKTVLIIISIFFLFTIQSAFSEEIVYPKKKPNLPLEENIKKFGELIIPKLKPGTKKEEKLLEEIPEKIIAKKIDGVIIPKNKPLIVKKQRLTVSKTNEYYSDRDLVYAKQAIEFMEKSNWKDAIKVAKKARASSIYEFIQWRHLLTLGNNAKFSEYKQFIETVQYYPRIDRIKYLAEHKISLENQSPREILAWFEKNPPLSGYGKMMMGESLIKFRKQNEGINLIKEGFVTADLTKNDLRFFSKNYKKYLIEQPIITSNKNIYTVTYKENKLNIYLDETLIKTINNVPKIYFDKNNIEINPYRDWNAHLYSILIYNKELSNNDIKFLNSYFKKNILDNQLNIKKNSIENFENNQETMIETTKESYNDFLSEYDNKSCPEVHKENDKYSFDVTNTEWAKSAGLQGKKFYDNRKKCMNEYKSMYKQCEIPKILREPKKLASNCIFNGIHTGNPSEHPCQLCPELDNYKYGSDIKISSKCKNSIKSYCYNQVNKNTGIDKNCLCFTPEYSNTVECQNFLLELHDNHIDYSAIKN